MAAQPEIATNPVVEEPFWGEPTTTLDWCEANYTQVFFIAELWNTLSNLAIILPCFHGIWVAYTSGSELRFILSYIGLIMVGVGSWLFHMTLLWEMQLLDELPMVYASCMFLFAIASPRPKHSLLVTLALAAYAVAVTSIYLVSKEALFHQVAYGIQVATIMYLSYRKAMTTKYAGLRVLFFVAITSYLLGFALWNIDNTFCPSLVSLRSDYPLCSPLFQLHAWWHVGTGIGSYLYIVFSEGVRCEELGHKVRLTTWMLLPTVAVPDRSASNTDDKQA